MGGRASPRILERAGQVLESKLRRMHVIGDECDGSFALYFQRAG